MRSYWFFILGYILGVTIGGIFIANIINDMSNDPIITHDDFAVLVANGEMIEVISSVTIQNNAGQEATLLAYKKVGGGRNYKIILSKKTYAIGMYVKKGEELKAVVFADN